LIDLDYGEIRDPIHGNIDLDQTETKIINTPEMQRLRYIRQLDMAYLIFPGANHCRFEHSLGTMQVTKELTSSIYKDKMREFSYVGLLHDIGHGPFSHLTEFAVKKYLKKSHEQMGEEIIKNSEISDILSDSGFSVKKILGYFREPEKVDIVGGTLGSDRIDYLMRDSHYTGVAYGVIDYDRLKATIVAHKGKLAIDESGLSGAESLLIARYFMYSNIYSHHAKIIAAKMLEHAVELCLEEGAFDAKEMSRMYDEELLIRIRDSNVRRASAMVERLMIRKLFKRAYYKKIDSDIDVMGLQSAIEKAGFGRERFIVHVRSLGGAEDDVDVIGMDGNSVGKLSEISPFMQTLIGVLQNSRMLLVACDKKDISGIERVVVKFLK
jgi:HD superfamily phosphohydrolase